MQPGTDSPKFGDEVLELASWYTIHVVSADRPVQELAPEGPGLRARRGGAVPAEVPRAPPVGALGLGLAFFFPRRG